MRIGIIGKKIGMTEVFEDSGALVPVTVIDTTGCEITQIKTKEKDGYSAIQVGYGDRKPQNVTKARQGHFKKAGVKAKAKLHELRVESDEEVAHLKTGNTLSPSMFEKGDRVDVTGVTKGRGFAGVFRRYGFDGPNATHGSHEIFRGGGSIGTNTFPGRVMKNRGMPGHMGDVQRTILNVEVHEVKSKDNLVLLKGAVPGSDDSIVIIRGAKKSPLPKERAWTV